MNALENTGDENDRPYQVSLRTMLVGVTAIAVAFALARLDPRSHVLNHATFAIVQGLLICHTYFALRQRRGEPIEVGMRLGTTCGGAFFGGYLGLTANFGTNAKSWLGALVEMGGGMFCGWIIAFCVSSVLIFTCRVEKQPVRLPHDVGSGAFYGAFTGGISTCPAALLHPVVWFILGGVAALVGAIFGGWGAWVLARSESAETSAGPGDPAG
jgi:hypothetical protein